LIAPYVGSLGTSRFGFELEVSSSQVNSHNGLALLETYWLNHWQMRRFYLLLPLVSVMI